MPSKLKNKLSITVEVKGVRMFRSKSKVTQETVKPRLVLFLGIFVAFLLITVTGYSDVWTKRNETTDLFSTSVQRTERPEVEIITITADGFEPQEIVRPAGRFLLSVTNRSGLDSLNFRLESE